jgi:hypothetical protein
MSSRSGGIPGGGIPGGGYFGSRPRKKQPFVTRSKDQTEASGPSRPLVQEAIGNLTDQGAGDHPGGDMGSQEALDERLDPRRQERRKRQVSEINQSLLQLKEQHDSLHIAEIRASKPKSEQYQKAALRIAGKSLGAARSALIMERLGRRNLNPEQIRATVIALQNELWWDELLRSYDLAGNEAARSAARDLADRVSNLEADKVSVDSLNHLIADIDFLRKEIDLASRQTGFLSPGLVHEYITAASSVASQVMIGLAAASATAEATGARIVPDVIYSAIGLAVASSMTEIYRRASRNLKARTVLAQLQEYHYELIGAVKDLAWFMSWLTGPPPPSEDALNAARSACLAAGFLVSHVEQLALSFTWPERSQYRDVLHSIRKLLKEIRNAITEQRFRDIEELRGELSNASRRLQDFNTCIDGLRFDS